MRIVVVGAGAVGGVVAANLALAGTPVVELPVATSVAEVDVAADDVIMLGVKGQDTVSVLNDLRSAGVTDQPIVCMQNGVDNERQALRLFPKALKGRTTRLLLVASSGLITVMVLVYLTGLPPAP